tara:strand:+ start:231 stop:533 length:303 start_codon:yes stop_codon:yes gene_type:complete
MSGLGYGAFNGNDGGLKGAMDAAKSVMQQNANLHDPTPKGITPELVEAAANDVLKHGQTIEEKNNVIRHWFKQIPLHEDEQHGTAAVAAFEKAVMQRLGR